MMTFNMHPKGVIPLDGVEVETVRAGPTKTMISGFRISHKSFGTKSLLLCCQNDTERDRWVAAVNASKTVTYPQYISLDAQLQLAKRDIAESHRKLAALNKKNDQIAKLVAQNKALQSAIAGAEAKFNTSIPVDYSAVMALEAQQAAAEAAAEGAVASVPLTTFISSASSTSSISTPPAASNVFSAPPSVANVFSAPSPVANVFSAPPPVANVFSAPPPVTTFSAPPSSASVFSAPPPVPGFGAPPPINAGAAPASASDSPTSGNRMARIAMLKKT
jgi:PH domain